MTNKTQTGGYIKPDIHAASERKPYIITAAQNNTDVCGEFLDALKTYADFLYGELLICPILYNKNAWAQPDDSEDVFFVQSVRPYMLEDRVSLRPDVLLVGNAHVLPTAKNPLSGFDGVVESGQWAIIPASKVALSCGAALKGDKPKTLLSTGTVTLKNYIQRKAGVTAELEHNMGAVIVPADGVPRSIVWTNGAFYDFDAKAGTLYHSAIHGYVSKRGELSPVAALVFGDIHAEKCDQWRLDAMANIAENLKPELIVTHDSLDFSTRNHHNKKDPFFIYGQDKKGGSVKGDLKLCKRMLQGFAHIAPVYVVQSNHDRALDRWIVECDWREDTLNADLYFKLAKAKLRTIKQGGVFNALSSALGNMLGVTFLNADESFKVCGVELGNHGDKGLNGARGSAQGFRKLGVPLVIGHSHTPTICGEVYQVGVGGNLEMGYNEGASSWRHAHCVVYANGQRQIIIEA